MRKGILRQRGVLLHIGSSLILAVDLIAPMSKSTFPPDLSNWNHDALMYSQGWSTTYCALKGGFFRSSWCGAVPTARNWQEWFGQVVRKHALDLIPGSRYPYSIYIGLKVVPICTLGPKYLGTWTLRVKLIPQKLT